MKKTLLKKMLCLLLASCVIILAAGCTPSKSVQKKVLNYLHEKYGNNYDFEYVSYTQNKETSGRYEVNARCRNDGLDFKIFVYSSVLITDSYSVDRANAAMEKSIREFLLSRDYSDSIEKITWLNVFEDDATDYKFRTVPITEHYDLSDAENIYRVEMSDDLNPYQFVGGIYNFNADLLDSGVELKSASFSFEYKDLTFVVETDSKSIKKYSYGETIEKMVPIIETNASVKKGIFSIDKVCTIKMDAAMRDQEFAVHKSVH